MAAVTDLSGHSYGLVQVLRREWGDVWRCRCRKCSRESSRRGCDLRRGHHTSCVCNKTSSLTGRKFGKLKVIGQAPSDAHGNSMWLCECSCGQRKVVRGQSLLGLVTRSCGHK